MNVYVILLRPFPVRRRNHVELVSLKADALRGLAESLGVELLDVLACQGICDAVLLCRAPDSPTLSHLLDALKGWQTETLLASSHVRYEPTFRAGAMKVVSRLK